jgi:acyl-CoA dehydrogenase
MSSTPLIETGARTDWTGVVHTLGPRFAERAAAHDATDTFVVDNYRDLKEARALSAGVPAALGGGDASHAELCAMLRALAGHCSSTALALAMHTHLVATTAYRWRHDGAPVDGLLRRVAAEQLVLVSTGGSDWIDGSGKAVKVEGGYRVTARKIFGSGSPVGDLLMTMAILDDPDCGPTVLHFPVPLNAPGVKVHDNWRTLGMRGTGSNDVDLEDVFVPDAAVGIRRPAGRWGKPFFQIASVALPLIYAVYVGIAEAARDLALRAAQKRRQDPATQRAVGAMENELTVARMAMREMTDAAASIPLDESTTNRVLVGRTVAGRASIATVERALEVAGGAGFFRDLGLERLFRDVQAARYHPVKEPLQTTFTGRMALGLSPD